MINKDNIQVFMHLFYKDQSVYLMDKIRTKWEGPVSISLNEDGEDNIAILAHAKNLFPEVNVVICKNFGTDTVGFKNLTNKWIDESKNFILYAHDKSAGKEGWIDDIVDPIINQEKLIDELLKTEEYGIISSAKRCENILDEEYLVELSKVCKTEEKYNIVGSRHTLIWLRELQYILYQNHGLINKKHINFKFTAGTMFLIHKDVAKIANDCVHESFFEKQYRQDGKVEHALERFYYYVSACLRKKIMFI